MAAYPDASRRVVTIYEDGEPVRRFRARKMDEQYVLHGWYEYLKPRGNSVCYQHAVQIHATECADL
ncbi:secreted protein [Bordetella pertussis]|nr:secreted protein [Bordetella pertussis]CPH70467.1 secreted protein [Bordetella pertussis]CPK44722.1 secreted protein [Bordetella pertussis]